MTTYSSRVLARRRRGFGSGRQSFADRDATARRERGFLHQSGFTLLEIMLVVLLIAITATFVNLSIAPDPGKAALREGERVAALIRELMDESVLRGRAMSLVMDAEQRRYSFQISRTGNWEAVTGSDVFRPRVIPRPIEVSLEIHGDSPRPRETDDDEDTLSDARIVVDPVGEITPFRILLTAPGHTISVMLDEFHQLMVSAASP